MKPEGSAGFTLIELAIVLFIITVLVGGMLTPLSRQISDRQHRETRQILEDARLALAGYALSHRTEEGRPYLPCPDRKSGEAAGDGREDRLPDGRCAIASGLLPWHTLGVAEGDAWGNRLSYAVRPAWADPAAGLGESGEETPLVCPDVACAHPLEAAVVLVSHGRNGLGARNGVGRDNLPAQGEEAENANTDLRFLHRPPRDGDRPGGEFDDLVTWQSPAWLLGRLCDPAAACAPTANP